MLFPPIPARVLIADDDEDDISFLKEAMEEIDLSCEFAIATDGAELIHRLKQEPLPDIIFLDINMPKTNGLECLEAIRGSSFARLVTVLCLSTSRCLDIVKNAQKLGASGYITKPNSIKGYRKMLQKVFSMDWKARKGSDFFLHIES